MQIGDDRVHGRPAPPPPPRRGNFQVVVLNSATVRAATTFLPWVRAAKLSTFSGVEIPPLAVALNIQGEI